MVGLNGQEIISTLKKELGINSKIDQKLIETITSVTIKNNEKIKHDLKFNHTESGKAKRSKTFLTIVLCKYNTLTP